MQSLPEKQEDLHPVMDDLTHSSLGKIIQKAKWLLALDRYVQTILPASLASYCHVMNVDQSILILGVSNAAMATRIRFMFAELIEKLHEKKEFSHIQTIHCRVCAKTVRY
jgi:hypothetical protein